MTRKTALQRILWAALLLVVMIASSGCSVVPPEGVGPHVPPDWSSVTPTSTPGPAPKALATLIYPFSTFPNMPVLLTNFARPEGCNWMGVAGQVFDLQGNPVSGIVVKVGGQIGANQINNMSTTGNVPEYGEGGYEIDLAGSPVTTTGSLWALLQDQQGKQISPRYFFNTLNDCTKNLILFNFRENPANQYYFPVVFR